MSREPRARQDKTRQEKTRKGKDMARIKLLADEELDETTRANAQAMEARGLDTSTLRGLANSQDFFNLYNQFYYPARKGHSLPESLIEMVRLRIARHNDCFT
tara:strand:+ start:17 stop:322 length:306 start_codon:yes stop_codon:yes gene_type:complete